jgi:hypothetical protein
MRDGPFPPLRRLRLWRGNPKGGPTGVPDATPRSTTSLLIVPLTSSRRETPCGDMGQVRIWPRRLSPADTSERKNEKSASQLERGAQRLPSLNPWRGHP